MWHPEHPSTEVFMNLLRQTWAGHDVPMNRSGLTILHPSMNSSLRRSIERAYEIPVKHNKHADATCLTQEFHNIAGCSVETGIPQHREQLWRRSRRDR
ncbi:hypothetical protein DOTSEDRAFT_75024 [Dothistroma septosporum NZE10]|uniref:Uncharacterized protein n=1 Tax=Dothistroma septosporum (strain NZE10 / CBS 128990) TaxID=675120 RepID=M2WJI4_DOTSN|nr:hypothetical protein DOTSEDRAFT_75024 [Dothistroma septosporum NZE10]